MKFLASGLALFCLIFFVGCGGSSNPHSGDPTPSPGNPGPPPGGTPPPPPISFSGMLGWHNDAGITGQNLQETTLNPTNVNQNTFGKLFSYSLDDQSYAQPLYVAN